VANAFYSVFKNRILDPNMAGQAAAATDLNSDTINIALLSSGYTFSAAHTNYSQISANLIGSPVTVTSPTVGSVAAGVFDAADTTFTAVTAGSTVARYVVYKHNATAANAELIAYFDTNASAAAISVATNGGDITIAHNASGIFSVA
jgi:hypothetical protein